MKTHVTHLTFERRGVGEKRSNHARKFNPSKIYHILSYNYIYIYRIPRRRENYTEYEHLAKFGGNNSFLHPFRRNFNFQTYLSITHPSCNFGGWKFPLTDYRYASPLNLSFSRQLSRDVSVCSFPPCSRLVPPAFSPTWLLGGRRQESTINLGEIERWLERDRA